jgi:hypothetical protein
MVVGEIDKILDDFIEFQGKRLLKASGIADKLEFMKNAKIPLSQVPGLTQEDMSTFMHNLYTQLFSLSAQLLNPQHQCDRITSARYRVYARGRVTDALSNGYATIYAAVHDPKNEYTNAKEFAFHTPQQVKTLLE